jgi:hypothetical protein
MAALETVGVLLFATLFQLPFLIGMALPMLIVAWIVAMILRRYVSAEVRIVIVSGLAAVGLAPVYGFHLSMVPAYWLLLSGYSDYGTAVTSFVIVWALLALISLAFAKVWQRRPSETPNSTLDTDAPSERGST